MPILISEIAALVEFRGFKTKYTEYIKLFLLSFGGKAMKTRIISGAVMVALLICVVIAQVYYPPVLTVFLALLSGMGVYEILYATGLNKNKIMVFVGVLLAALVPFSIMGIINLPINIIYTVFAAIMLALSLKYSATVTVGSLAASVIFPIILSYAFSSIGVVTQSGKLGILYLILLFCFSSVADTGAYFTGVFFGKHKMAPVISPKKTWEGFVGGMAFGVLVTFLACIIYSAAADVNVDSLKLTLSAPIFVVAGVLGDLSASLIKRQCGIKDYGNLIPGHGGIMDRFDSILMIAPLFLAFLQTV